MSQEPPDVWAQAMSDTELEERAKGIIAELPVLQREVLKEWLQRTGAKLHRFIGEPRCPGCGAPSGSDHFAHCNGSWD